SFLPAGSTLFPYTTLFRSSIFEVVFHLGDYTDPVNESLRVTFTSRQTLSATAFSNRGNAVVGSDLYGRYASNDVRRGLFMNGVRSEEHTSELQSRENLVCR